MIPIIPILIGATALLLYDSKVKAIGLGKLNPFGNKAPDENLAHPSAPARPVPAHVPGNLTVDGHGTGLLPSVDGEQPSRQPTNDELVAIATLAAENAKLDIIRALNRPG